MAGYVFVIREVHHPLAVGRDVREPVVAVAGDELFLPGAVGLHAPDLHAAGALGVEVDKGAVGRVLRAVVEAGSRGQSLLIFAIDGDGIDVGCVSATRGKGQRLAIGRPAVPIGRTDFGYQPRRAARDGENKDARFLVLLRLATDGQPLAIGRDAMVVVALVLGSRGDDGGFRAAQREPVDQAVLVEEEGLAVGGPVGSFKVAGPPSIARAGRPRQGPPPMN